MPGSSLWLLPPASHPLNTVLSSLIDKTSSHFNSPHRFLPHVTLTSEISTSTYSSDPQAWLNSLRLSSANEVQVKFEKLDSEDVFVRKLYIKCKKNDGVKKLGQRCRQHVDGFGEDEKAKKWAEESYMPHLSLLYHDCPKVDAEGLPKVETFSQEIGVSLNGQGELSGWEGGRVVLVPTDKPIDQWIPIAERTL